MTFKNALTMLLKCLKNVFKMILKMQCTFQLFHTFFQASQDQNHCVAATALLAAGGHRLDPELVTRMIPRFHQYCLVNHGTGIDGFLLLLLFNVLSLIQ
jgi:hypothetical protein